jgi:translation initiation factor 3 subunit A
MEWGCFLCTAEFIEVGKPARALDTLYEVFRNKKWAYSWSESVLEPIMFKYLDLCVELKKSHIAKEGLFQYRNMFQSVSLVPGWLTEFAVRNMLGL